MRLRNNILVIICLLLAGCNPAGKFSVMEVEMPTLVGLASVHGRLAVESAARSDVMIESATLVIRYRETELATARLMLPIEVPARRVSRVRWDLALENTSLGKLQTLQTRIRTNTDRITVDVNGYVLWGGLRKKVEIKGVPVMRIIANFGAL